MDKIEGVSVEKLVNDFGSPLFVVSAKTIRDNLKRFRGEFSARYPKVEVAYSYKANCLSGVLDIIHNEGAWAEVASGFEYELARKIGVPGESIVFNGPYKKKEEIKKAIREGALINVDNESELKLLEEITFKSKQPIEVGIRINTDVGINQLPDRFGFNIESGKALEIVNYCTKKTSIRIAGIHIHITSYIISPEVLNNKTPAKSIELIWPKDSNLYRLAAHKITYFAEEIRKRFGITLKYIDMGGGYPTLDSITSYANAIVEPMLEMFDHEHPLLILEPGRAVVKDAVELITTVVDVKELSNDTASVVVDSGINILPTSFWKFQQIEPINKKAVSSKETVVYGPLCLQTDILGITKLPDLNVGDRLVIKNVGAYNISQASSFIFPLPSIILTDNNKVKVLRSSETIKDVI
ncbi:MAG TPA: alanine racemase [Thermodesulfobacteriota bacterium]